MADDPEGIPPELLDAYQKFARLGDVLRDAVADLVEQVRPAFDALTEAVSRPEVQEAMTDWRNRPRLQARPCYCLCGAVHPGAPGICDGQGTVIVRLTVSVPFCAPCAAARRPAALESSGG